jgi:multidrug efflux pump subunit AcrA (membrane-fusion protein)
MADEGEQIHMDSGSNAGKWVLIIVALVVVAAAAYAHYTTHLALEKLNSDLAASQAQVKELQNRMQTSEAEQETLAQQAGMTKKELAQRTAQLQAEQRAAAARLEKAQKESITAVSGDIAGVKTDVGGVKTDLGTTKADLEATKAKLQTAVGDLTGQSTLIAATRSDLELLKHKGDRNYYEFTLLKGAKPQPVSTVSLQLKKADTKRGKFTLNVTSDDKTIEKKDRNVAEPIQFYSGREHLLFELVIWTVEKDKATGYLSTPKGAPVPVTASPTTGSGN